MAWRARRRRRESPPGGELGFPGEPEGERREDVRLFVFLVVISGLILLSFLIFPGSSDLRWAVLVLVLVVTGVFVSLSLYRSGTRVPPLEVPAEPGVAVRGSLSRLTTTLRRADRGMRFSQVLVAHRVREAFLTRMQAERGLTEAQLTALLTSPTELDRFTKDPFIQAFLEDTAASEEDLVRGQGEGRPLGFRFARRGGFAGGIARVLAAMEAWR